jgi:hypothetical protein
VNEPERINDRGPAVPNPPHAPAPESAKEQVSEALRALAEEYRCTTQTDVECLREVLDDIEAALYAGARYGNILATFHASGFVLSAQGLKSMLALLRSNRHIPF